MEKDIHKKLTIDEAAQECTELFGIQVTPGTVWAWARRGVRGVRLKYSRAGWRLLTTIEDLRKFHDELMRRDAESVGKRGVGALMQEKLLKIGDVRQMLGVSTRQVWRLRDRGTLPAPIKLGGSVRWRQSDLLRWIEAGCPDVRRASHR